MSVWKGINNPASNLQLSSRIPIQKLEMCDKEIKARESEEATPSSSTNLQEMEDTERKLTKKARTSIKLPEQLDVSSKEETQVVGDDFNRKDEQNIVCECQPSVAGAALPSLSSMSNASDENAYKPAEGASRLDHEAPGTSKASSDNKVTKKPSMIPKLARPNSSNRPVRDRGQTDLLKKSMTKEPPTKKVKTDGKNVGTGTSLEEKPSSKISSRMLNLQERLKATTSMLRQRFKEDKTKTDSSCQMSSGCSLAKKESIGSQTSVVEANASSVEELYKAIMQLRSTATSLSCVSVLRKQKNHIKKLLIKIGEIQKIADQLTKFESDDAEGVVDGKEEARAKDNKILIKFVPKKDKNIDPKNKGADDIQGVQAELAKAPKQTSKCVKPEAKTIKAHQEISMKDSDSLDGIFIPSCEPPINIEEEEETNGLDITITFPEINNFLSQQEDSHLSVRLSDISEEALKKLKRCPKDFTLRMDFIQGKVLFQTGKAPVNNFSIGPDFKFVENPVDEKKSDIISIKPSTECSFASQLIPVENVTKEIASYKSLRSTDSELFSVVNLPFIYRNPSLHTTTKSCITFKNEGILSMALLARHLGRSMPQIPSLTNIFEEKIMENLNKATALQIQEKRRKNRANQRRGIITPNII